MSVQNKEPDHGAADVPEMVAHPRRWTTFDALRDRNYRWLWVERLASSATFQMGTVAQGWLVYQLWHLAVNSLLSGSRSTPTTNCGAG